MYYISPTAEKFIDLYVLSIFIVSSIASILTFYCLIKVRKSLQSTMRTFFIYIQVVVSMNEVHQDILFDGFPLFPQYAAYCKGVLCDMQVPMTASFGVVVFLICQVVVAVIASLSHRHHSILPIGHRLKIDQKKRRAVHIFLIISLTVPCVAMLFVPVDPVITDILISKSPYNLTWIRDRGKMYGSLPRSLLTESACIFMLGMLLVATFFFVMMIVHITIILRSEKHRSKASSKRIRNSFANLSFQLSVPNLLIVFPASVIMLGLYSEKLIPFELSFALYYVMHLHTFVHSVMVLGLTPAFRQFIFEKFRIAFKKANYKTRTPSITVGS